MASVRAPVVPGFPPATLLQAAAEDATEYGYGSKAVGSYAFELVADAATALLAEARHRDLLAA